MSLSASFVILAALRAFLLLCFLLPQSKCCSLWGNVIGSKSIGITIIIMNLLYEYPFSLFFRLFELNFAFWWRFFTRSIASLSQKCVQFHLVLALVITTFLCFGHSAQVCCPFIDEKCLFILYLHVFVIFLVMFTGNVSRRLFFCVFSNCFILKVSLICQLTFLKWVSWLLLPNFASIVCQTTTVLDQKEKMLKRTKNEKEEGKRACPFASEWLSLFLQSTVLDLELKRLFEIGRAQKGLSSLVECSDSSSSISQSKSSADSL